MMTTSIIILVVVFVLLLLANVPISITIGIATLFTMLVSMPAEPAVTQVAQKIATGLDRFALLAIPFFILSGQLMGQGGIARRLIDLAKAMMGTLPGGLGGRRMSCVAPNTSHTSARTARTERPALRGSTTLFISPPSSPRCVAASSPCPDGPTSHPNDAIEPIDP